MFFHLLGAVSNVVSAIKYQLVVAWALLGLTGPHFNSLTVPY